MFEYDPEKSAANKAKHGIDFDEAQALWADEKRAEIRTKDGDDGEERWFVIGLLGGRFWSAVVTYRSTGVRIISVRRSRNDERALYDRGRV